MGDNICGGLTEAVRSVDGNRISAAGFRCLASALSSNPFSAMRAYDMASARLPINRACHSSAPLHGVGRHPAIFLSMLATHRPTSNARTSQQRGTTPANEDRLGGRWQGT